MTTDQDRALARRITTKICEHRKNNAGGDINHFAKNVTLEEAWYMGVLTEIAFAKRFGLEVDDNLYRYGDGGRDFLLNLLVHGPTCINVKTKKVTYSLQGLIRSGTDLRVAVREIKPDTIYIFGAYIEPSDTADVHRWAWGKTLIDRNKKMDFENGDGTLAFTLPFAECLPLGQLKAMATKNNPCQNLQ